MSDDKIMKVLTQYFGIDAVTQIDIEACLEDLKYAVTQSNITAERIPWVAPKDEHGPFRKEDRSP